MRLSVDQHKCIGSGQCVMAADDVFDQDENDGTVVLLDENPPSDRLAAVREAVSMCPVGAIGVVDE